MLAVKPEGKIPLGRPRHRWVTILKRTLEKYCINMWTSHVAQDRVQWQVLVSESSGTIQREIC
jgi:hypothetical protein